MEYIPTTGEVNLSRDNLVVICGPKSSPVAAEALATDPRLVFATVPDGRWALTERATGRVFTSPSDDPAGRRPSDVAYLGRLLRPDGGGSFIHIAGVHAIGSLGAVTYLDGHLAELYDELGVERFSMVIGCDYDEDKELVVRAEALTPPLRHGEGAR